LEKSGLRPFFRTVALLSPAKGVAFAGCFVAILEAAGKNDAFD
jgi:hypothetical protein